MARVRVQQVPEPVKTIQVPQAAPDVRPPAPVDPHTAREHNAPQQQQPYYPPQQTDQAAVMPSQGIFISRRKMLWAAAAVLVVVGLYTAYTNRERPQAPGTLGTSQELPGATTEAQAYYNEISPHVELPAGEAPTVLNVSDAEEVKKDNAALTDIKNGDKMLFFTKSRKLVVYRPATKKVIAVVSLAAPAAPAASPAR